MFLQRQVVSRKTPGDGRLEVTTDAAARIAEIGPVFPIHASGRTAAGSLESMACTCEKSAGESHQHFFLESEVLRALTPGAEVTIAFDEEERGIRVGPAEGASSEEPPPL